jgi:hypothetical protein
MKKSHSYYQLLAQLPVDSTVPRPSRPVLCEQEISSKKLRVGGSSGMEITTGRDYGHGLGGRIS